MKQFNLFTNGNFFEEQHPQFSKKINENYYGSLLNKFVAHNCKKDMVVNNIDLIINDYKTGNIKIIESKHSYEKLTKGQDLLLKKLSKLGLNVYCIYGDPPYNTARIYSYSSNTEITVNQETLIKFLNNEI